MVIVRVKVSEKNGKYFVFIPYYLIRSFHNKINVKALNRSDSLISDQIKQLIRNAKIRKFQNQHCLEKIRLT
jgi:hypothetical protein